MKSEKGKKVLKGIGIVLFLGILLYGTSKSSILKEYTAEDIKNYLQSFGALAPIVYIILFTLVPLTLFPDAILAIASGMGFGLIQGFIYTMIGALCGATLSFYISRILGKDIVKKLIKHDIQKFDHAMEKRGFYVILMLRLIPLVPFDVISYSAGLSEIKYKDFLLGTIVGTIPGILVYTNLGDKSTQIGTSSFYLSIALLIVLFVSSYAFKKKLSVEELCAEKRSIDTEETL